MIPMQHRTSLRLKFALLATALSATLLLVAGCGKKNAASQAARPPTEVGVIVIAPEAVTLSQELPGRTSAFRVAEVRARISGIVQKRLFTEGADVKEGEILFEIDPAPYLAALDSAKATLARAEAGLASAQFQADRFKGLVSTNAISQQTYDDAVAGKLGFAADVAAGKAAVQSAEINLGYTRVTSPIGGRIGRASVTEGAYVQQGAATLLATVQQLDPLYVDLSQSAGEIMRLKQALASGRLQRSSADGAKLSLTLNNQQPYAHAGSLQFSDVTVNSTTGTITLRALFPNPDNDLLPGMFVRAHLEEGTAPDAILVPQSAVSRNTKGEATALVATAEKKVELRVLKTSRTIGNRWLVSEGLKPGDQVIVTHLQKIRPGMVVNPVPTGTASAAASASANPAR